MKVNGVWRYVYRAIDQHGQFIDVLVSARRDTATARRFVREALSTLMVAPLEVVTDAAPIYPAVLEELAPADYEMPDRTRCEPMTTSERPSAMRAGLTTRPGAMPYEGIRSNVTSRPICLRTRTAVDPIIVRGQRRFEAQE